MATYQTIVLLNLSKWENPGKPGTGFTLDVVQSIMDGKSKGVGVEKAYWKDGGAKRMPKMLSRMDFKRCAEKWSEILNLMEHPPAVPPPAEPEPLSDAGMGSAPLDVVPMDSGPLEQTEF